MAGALTAAVRNYWVDSDNWSRKHQRMEPIVSSIIDALVERGIDRSWIRTGREASLPASFGLRDTRWDIVIIKDEIPLGAIEFTAQSGLSAAHNLANRIHEATSRALAVRSSDHNGGLQPQLGLFIMFEQGTNTSVQPRLEAALNQFLDDELYDEVAYTYYSDAGLQEPSEGMSVQRFVDRFSRHAARTSCRSTRGNYAKPGALPRSDRGRTGREEGLFPGARTQAGRAGRSVPGGAQSVRDRDRFQTEAISVDEGRCPDGARDRDRPHPECTPTCHASPRL